MDYMIERIIEIALGAYSGPNDSIHGLKHWIEVYRNGIILSLQAGVNSNVVNAFAYLHDCKRTHDGPDMEHGPLAAKFIERSVCVNFEQVRQFPHHGFKFRAEFDHHLTVSRWRTRNHDNVSPIPLYAQTRSAVEMTGCWLPGIISRAMPAVV